MNIYLYIIVKHYTGAGIGGASGLYTGLQETRTAQIMGAVRRTQYVTIKICINYSLMLPMVLSFKLHCNLIMVHSFIARIGLQHGTDFASTVCSSYIRVSGFRTVSYRRSCE